MSVSKTENEINEVKEEIRKVKEEIRKVAAKIESEKDAEEKKHIRKEKEQMNERLNIFLRQQQDGELRCCSRIHCCRLINLFGVLLYCQSYMLSNRLSYYCIQCAGDISFLLRE
jgi:hypothetical protein